MFKNKYLIEFFLFYLSWVIFSAALSAFKGTYDFSILRSNVNILISLPFAFILAYYINYNYRSKYTKPFFNILLVQSVIIFSMMFFPIVNDFISGFSKTEEEIYKMSVYNGARGYGLSGSIAFGLAILMGLLGYISCLNPQVKNKYMSSILILLCVFCSLSAGRTSILGWVLGIGSIFLFSTTVDKIKILCRFIIILTIGVIIVRYVFLTPEVVEKIYFYSRYVFQMVYNYIEYGSFSVSSLERLDEMYYYPSAFFFGEAKYLDLIGGGYYGDTDAGFMRNIIYYGFFISFFYYLYYIRFILKLSFLISPEDWFKRYLFLFSILSISFIYQYKGEVILYNVGFMKVLFVLFFCLVFYRQSDLECMNMEKK